MYKYTFLKSLKKSVHLIKNIIIIKIIKDFTKKKKVYHDLKLGMFRIIRFTR